MSSPDAEKAALDNDFETTASSNKLGHVPTQVLAHSHDADEAMKAFQSRTGEVLVLDEATNKRLLRRIDWNLMPIMCVIYGLNYLDKTTISYASIMGMNQDLKLVGDDYQWLGSLFYFGYLGWEYPTNRLLQRLPLGKYSAVNIMLWGMTLSCFAAVTNFQGAIAIRIFLGVFESAVTPGMSDLFQHQASPPSSIDIALVTEASEGTSIASY